MGIFTRQGKNDSILFGTDLTRFDFPAQDIQFHFLFRDLAADDTDLAAGFFHDLVTEGFRFCLSCRTTIRDPFFQNVQLHLLFRDLTFNDFQLTFCFFDHGLRVSGRNDPVVFLPDGKFQFGITLAPFVRFDLTGCHHVFEIIEACLCRKIGFFSGFQTGRSMPVGLRERFQFQKFQFILFDLICFFQTLDGGFHLAGVENIFRGIQLQFQIVLFDLKFGSQNLDRCFDPLLFVQEVGIIQLDQQIAFFDLVAGPAENLFHGTAGGRDQFVCIFRDHGPLADDRIVHIDQEHKQNSGGQHEKRTDDQPCKETDFSTETALKNSRLRCCHVLTHCSFLPS